MAVMRSRFVIILAFLHAAAHASRVIHASESNVEGSKCTKSRYHLCNVPPFMLTTEDKTCVLQLCKEGVGACCAAAPGDPKKSRAANALKVVGKALQAARVIRVKASADLEKPDFICPDECVECCVDKVGVLKSASKKVFKCMLRDKMPKPKLPADRHCSPPAARQGAGQSNQGKTRCEFSASEKDAHAVEHAAEVLNGSMGWKAPPPGRELRLKCSTKSRCCCDEAKSFCVADQPRIIDGKPLKLEYGGKCPPYSGDYDVNGNECKCEESCGAHSNPPIAKRALPTDPAVAQMSSIADGVYFLDHPISGWSLEKSWDAEHIYAKSVYNVAVYSKLLREPNDGYACTLAITGTNDLDDVKADVNVASKSWCGIHGVHTGFASKTEVMMEGERFEEFAQYLRNPKMCTKVYVVGHSLGGAIAYLTTMCASVYKKLFPVHGVYTMGAPAATKDALEWPYSADGCMPGFRFYNEDKWGADPVPMLTRVFDYTHPLTNAVSVRDLGKGQIVLREAECAHASRGLNGRLNRPKFKMSGAKVGLHGTDHYNDRLAHPSRIEIRNNGSHLETATQLKGVIPDV